MEKDALDCGVCVNLLLYFHPAFSIYSIPKTTRYFNELILIIRILLF